jgi:ADP-ribose pyrophosphatase YjhB (NUDIX family)
MGRQTVDQSQLFYLFSVQPSDSFPISLGTSTALRSLEWTAGRAAISSSQIDSGLTGPVIRDAGPVAISRWSACLVPSRAEQYRAKSEACERLARKMSYSPARKELLELAQEWRDLADKQEQQER